MIPCVRGVGAQRNQRPWCTRRLDGCRAGRGEEEDGEREVGRWSEKPGAAAVERAGARFFEGNGDVAVHSHVRCLLRGWLGPARALAELRKRGRGGTPQKERALNARETNRAARNLTFHSLFPPPPLVCVPRRRVTTTPPSHTPGREGHTRPLCQSVYLSSSLHPDGRPRPGVPAGGLPACRAVVFHGLPPGPAGPGWLPGGWAGRSCRQRDAPFPAPERRRHRVRKRRRGSLPSSPPPLHSKPHRRPLLRPHL